MSGGKVFASRVDRSPPYGLRKSGETLWHIIGRDGFSIVATCYQEDEARALAAQPDLLAACESLLPLAESLIGPATDSDGKTLPAVEAARAAIAKARGGAAS